MMRLEPMYVFFTVLTKTKTLWAGMDGDLYGNQDCQASEGVAKHNTALHPNVY